MKSGFLSRLFSTVLLWAVSAVYADAQDLYSDTWVANDGLDRFTPVADEAPLKTDKTRLCGIFYVTWHDDGKYSTMTWPYSADVTKILQQDPSARLDGNHYLWKDPQYHWGEPEMGYFLSRDTWVIRKDMSMLVDAGVDVIILDCTNGVTYFSEWDTLLSTMAAIKAEGNKVPQICFWVYNGRPAQCASEIYNRYYKAGLYRDLWFYWDGKPLLLCNMDPSFDATSNPNGTDYSAEVKNFFTRRNMWWGYYMWNGKRYVGTEDNWSFGYDMHQSSVSNLAPKQRIATHQGRYEEMCVTPAQHSSSYVGKSWTVSGKQPGLDEYDMPKSKLYKKTLYKDPTKYGFYFQDRWDEALEGDPDFIYINDWNEWTAGKFPAQCTFMTRSSNYQFVDQYNAEFNRTIQPMKDGYTDNYYMQMVQNIRKYKGVRPSPKGVAPVTITINGNFNDWADVSETYYDTRGDVAARDYNGYGGLHYTNTTGRNDIVMSKVAVDKEKVYFYAETAANITSHTDKNWMLLFINSDQDYSTGWEGFDYVINYSVSTMIKSKVMKWDSTQSKWIDSGQTTSMRYRDNKLEIAVPLEAVGLQSGYKGGFDFKWADNPTSLNSILDLCNDGDTAPNRRFCYRYAWDWSSVPGSVEVVVRASQSIDYTYNESDKSWNGVVTSRSTADSPYFQHSKFTDALPYELRYLTFEYKVSRPVKKIAFHMINVERGLLDDQTGKRVDRVARFFENADGTNVMDATSEWKKAKFYIGEWRDKTGFGGVNDYAWINFQSLDGAYGATISIRNIKYTTASEYEFSGIDSDVVCEGASERLVAYGTQGGIVVETYKPYEVFTAYGQKVAEGTGYGATRVDVPASGLYIVRVGASYAKVLSK